MGWTIPYNMPHRADLIRERTETREWTREGITMRCVALKHCYRGGIRSGVLYIVWDRVKTHPHGRAESTRFIEVDLLRYYSEGRGVGNWGFKDMDCCTGPVVVSCPESYLDLCPPHVNNRENWCANWHQKVREHHANRKIKRVSMQDSVKALD